MIGGLFGGLFALVAQIGAICFWFLSAFYGLSHFSENGPAAVLTGVFSFAMAAATAHCLRRKFQWIKEDQKFKDWLIANAEKIRGGQLAFYRSHRITPETELVKHHLVFSALIVSSRSQTRWLIKGKEPRLWNAVAASLYTFIYGWWGFPFGIYWTIVALNKNIAGSTVVRVSDLLKPAPAKPEGFGEQFKSRFGRRMRAGFFIDGEPVGILPPEPVAKG